MVKAAPALTGGGGSKARSGAGNALRRRVLMGVGVALLAGVAVAAALVVVWDVRIEFRPDGGRYVYVDQYRDDQFHGWGVMLHSDGWRHAGEWRDGKPNGRGFKRFPDGSLYMGGFRDWQFDGVGVFELSSGRRLVGEWRDGFRFSRGSP